MAAKPPLSRTRRALVALAIASPLLFVAGGLVWETQVLEPRREEAAFGFLPAGVPAPAMDLQTWDGTKLPAAAFAPGKVVFVNFWATWCPPCVTEMPSMLQLGRDLSAAWPGKFEMLAVSVDEGWDPVTLFFQGKEPEGARLVLDPDQKVTQAYYCAARGACPDTIKFPESYVVRDGKIVAYVVGPREWSQPAARRFLEKLIRG